MHPRILTASRRGTCVEAIGILHFTTEQHCTCHVSEPPTRQRWSEWEEGSLALPSASPVLSWPCTSPELCLYKQMGPYVPASWSCLVLALMCSSTAHSNNQWRHTLIQSEGLGVVSWPKMKVSERTSKFNRIRDDDAHRWIFKSTCTQN